MKTPNTPRWNELVLSCLKAQQKINHMVVDLCLSVFFAHLFMQACEASDWMDAREV
mgnify:CR=1 FL=1